MNAVAHRQKKVQFTPQRNLSSLNTIKTVSIKLYNKCITVRAQTAQHLLFSVSIDFKQVKRPHLLKIGNTVKPIESRRFPVPPSINRKVVLYGNGNIFSTQLSTQQVRNKWYFIVHRVHWFMVLGNLRIIYSTNAGYCCSLAHHYEKCKAQRDNHNLLQQSTEHRPRRGGNGWAVV